jgi:acyl-CoA synthetase (AMP-forming)/AMP-acid ligase II
MMLEGVEIKDLVTMASVPSDGHTVGKIMVHGNMVMSGYYKDVPAMVDTMHRGGYVRGTSSSHRAAPERVYPAQGPVQGHHRIWR